ncbi:MAG: capsid protein [Clostridiales Family XIII bacterium]|jgi:hypothetical protein|nr:capsid protein [Clostridiales Family XIII bacterium]
MADNVVNYATKFEKTLKQKYTQELKTTDLTTPVGSQGLRFGDAKHIKIPYLNVGGYKDHGRAGGFNRQAVENEWMEKALAFDRDVEFFVDVMDVEETNQVLAAANLTNTFLTEQAIPETDCYRISKLYADFVSLGGVADTVAITAANILSKFDDLMEALDEDQVPEEGRMVYATPAIHKILKSAQGISRSVKNGEKAIAREVTRLDDVNIVKVPSARMKTAYNFTDGCVPGTTAGQINMLLLHPSAVIAADRHAYIKLWPPGTHTTGDGYLYQNRKYGDLFVIDTRVKAIKANITPYTPPSQG